MKENRSNRNICQIIKKKKINKNNAKIRGAHTHTNGLMSEYV